MNLKFIKNEIFSRLEKLAPKIDYSCAGLQYVFLTSEYEDKDGALYFLGIELEVLKSEIKGKIEVLAVNVNRHEFFKNLGDDVKFGFSENELNNLEDFKYF